MNEIILLISDLHACLDELKDLLNKVNYNKTKDRLISLGDVLNRGFYSIETLEYIMDNNIEMILGNHEIKYLQHYKIYTNDTNSKFYKQNVKSLPESRRKIFNLLTKTHFDFLEKLPLYIEFDPDWIAVHAGLNPYKNSIKDNTIEDFSTIRYLNTFSKEHIDIYGLRFIPNHIKYWTQEYNGNKNIVFGHNVFSLHTPEVYTNKQGAKTIGIDCGCVFGGNLTCFIFYPNSKHYSFEFIKARKTYYKSKYLKR